MGIDRIYGYSRNKRNVMTLNTDILTDLTKMTDWSVSATWKVAGVGAGTTITLLAFDSAYVEWDPQGVGVATKSPVAFAMSSDVTTIAVNDTLTINAVVYRLATQPEPDGLGVTILRLAR